MSARVVDLIPGDEVTILGFTRAVFVTRTEHPLWPALQLVVWRMPADWPAGDWSHDALAAAQEVGEITPTTPEERRSRLRKALVGAR